MPTTEYELYPFPDDEEWLNQGAYAIQQLAERLDQMQRKHSGNAVGDATQVALANNAWTNVGYIAASEAGELSRSGGLFTYTGTVARHFVIGFGANIAANGTQPNGALRLLHNGAVAAELWHSDNYQHLGGCVPLRLDPGNTIELAAYANDGSDALGGAYSHQFLRLTAL